MHHGSSPTNQGSKKNINDLSHKSLRNNELKDVNNLPVVFYILCVLKATRKLFISFSSLSLESCLKDVICIQNLLEKIHQLSCLFTKSAQ